MPKIGTLQTPEKCIDIEISDKQKQEIIERVRIKKPRTNEEANRYYRQEIERTFNKLVEETKEQIKKEKYEKQLVKQKCSFIKLPKPVTFNEAREIAREKTRQTGYEHAFIDDSRSPKRETVDIIFVGGKECVEHVEWLEKDTIYHTHPLKREDMACIPSPQDVVNGLGKKNVIDCIRPSGIESAYFDLRLNNDTLGNRVIVNVIREAVDVDKVDKNFPIIVSTMRKCMYKG